ncbi:hypothetical protein GPECTOR_34g811 [Gonium pectorale]|uniref:Uncharacterized protein n=1 Tax=Gonium pectorale TaxID=33097 RepID=A0A150GCU3_GONPE|nr:hypothetical protein GPECTOR_34g811 [Gonium pectorale]|eukprot:KXZ47652.1 hypothetical protein GPECTOR_34g811 [Gonium pectorale]
MSELRQAWGTVANVSQWFAFGVSVAILLFYAYEAYIATCGWEEVYVCCVELTKVVLEYFHEFDSPAMLYLGVGTRVQWLRYSEWLLTCPVILIHLSNLTGLKEDYSFKTMRLLVSDIGTIVFGATSAVCTGYLKWVFFAIGCVYGGFTFFTAGKVYREAYEAAPAGRCKWLVKVNAVIFFSSWTMYPVLFVLGPEGTGVISLLESTTAHTFVDLMSKNIWGLVGHTLRVAVWRHILTNGEASAGTMRQSISVSRAEVGKAMQRMSIGSQYGGANRVSIGSQNGGTASGPAGGNRLSIGSQSGILIPTGAATGAATGGRNSVCSQTGMAVPAVSTSGIVWTTTGAADQDDHKNRSSFWPSVGKGSAAVAPMPPTVSVKSRANTSTGMGGGNGSGKDHDAGKGHHSDVVVGSNMVIAKVGVSGAAADSPSHGAASPAATGRLISLPGPPAQPQTPQHVQRPGTPPTSEPSGGLQSAASAGGWTDAGAPQGSAPSPLPPPPQPQQRTATATGMGMEGAAGAARKSSSSMRLNVVAAAAVPISGPVDAIEDVEEEEVPPPTVPVEPPPPSDRRRSSVGDPASRPYTSQQRQQAQSPRTYPHLTAADI